ncbi:DUF5667 domain-containing protein [Patescibacteria group bacterium]|nr:DUF5667 domain-containing protein [Patescibacteria group bacterium]
MKSINMIKHPLKAISWFGAVGTALFILGISLRQASADSLEASFEAFSFEDQEATGSTGSGKLEEGASEEGTSSSSEQEPVTYSSSFETPSLPYPGMLPDSPFYWAKMVRDWVRVIFTHQPEKKADLFLLYADKRMAAALALVEDNKFSLAAQTVTKAEMYLARAGEEIERAVQKERSVQVVQIEYRLSVEKHGVLLDQLAEAFGANESLLDDGRLVHEQARQRV